MKQLRIEYDTEYGIAKLRGWSVAVDGMYFAQHRGWLVVALWVGWRGWRDYCRREEKRKSAGDKQYETA